jgi:hypothetical protein
MLGRFFDKKFNDNTKKNNENFPNKAWTNVSSSIITNGAHGLRFEKVPRCKFFVLTLNRAATARSTAILIN